jgi:hypothetical protein
MLALPFCRRPASTPAGALISSIPNPQSALLLAVRNDQVKMILRASPSGSLTIWHSLSQIIVLLVSGSVGSHLSPDMLAANAARQRDKASWHHMEGLN